MTTGQPAPTDWRKLFRETLPKKLVDFAIVIVVISPLGWLFTRFAREPWNALLIVAPLVVTAALIGRRAFQRQTLTMLGPFRWFCLLYSLIFAVVAGSDLPVWQRTPMTGFEDAAPKTFRGLAGLGDWRYRLASSGSPGLDLIVVTREPPLNLDNSRADLADLIARARRAGAKAVAFDLRLQDSSPLDARICRQVVAANQSTPPMTVLFGHGFQRINKELTAKPLASTIASCAPAGTSQGHLVVYLDADSTVRSLPLGLRRSGGLPALSVKTAGILSPSVQPDRSRSSQIFQPVPADSPYTSIRFADLTAENVELLRERVVLVGEESPAETFRTPWGKVLGVQLHAQAVDALVAGRHFRRLAWWPSAVAVLLGTYALALVAITARTGWPIVGMAVILTTAWGLIAAVAAWRRVWLDVGLVVLGIVLFAVILVLHRGVVMTRKE